MVKRIIILLLFVSMAFVIPASVSAKALTVKVSPKKIHQGDVFLVTVRGGEISEPPSGSLAKQELVFSECGDGRYCAVGAVDIATKPGRQTVHISAGKRKKNVQFSVKKARFPEIRMSLPEGKVSLCPEDLERVERENERLQRIFETATDRLWEKTFIVPLENDISLKFGAKRIMNKKMISVHRGVDIRGREGEHIKASNNGRIVLAEELFLGGNTIIVDHGQGIYSIYMHLSKFESDLNDTVSRGDVIGYVGSTGRSTGPHLHFGVKVNTISVNPFSLTRLPL
jgi:murein DD-endopeptidase MepM/ murein hydrolase activator NlpD